MHRFDLREAMHLYPGFESGVHRRFEWGGGACYWRSRADYGHDGGDF